MTKANAGLWAENEVRSSAPELSRDDALQFLKRTPFGTVSTVSREGWPEAAVCNLAATDDLEIVFETIQTTRKCDNLRQNSRVAIAVWRDDETLQYEGTADEPETSALGPLLQTLFAAQPELANHQGWPGLTYFRVRPRWIRLSRIGPSFSVRELRLSL
jgi:hypothetical protein